MALGPDFREDDGGDWAEWSGLKSTFYYRRPGLEIRRVAAGYLARN